MKDQQPLVSVLMPAFNAEAYISDSIESIIGQTYQNWELIIINDGSTDGTLQIVEGYLQKDSRIRLIEHDQNKGLVQTRNRGLEEANGTYIANLDSDDISNPDRLSTQVDFLEDRPDYLLVGSACQTIDSDGKIIGEIDRDIPDAHIPVVLIFSNYLINSSVMFRADVVKEIGYSSDIPIAEDYALFTVLSKRGKLGNLKKSLLKYRVHGTNISLRQEDALNRAVREIQKSQLKELNIEATEAELSMHQSLVNGASTSLGNDLADVETWLIRLIEANESNNSYDQSLLEHYCAFFFRRACEASGLGTKAIRVFKASPLSTFIRMDLKANFVFLVKSLTK